MINNRIFEALACGSIVATEYMKEIETYIHNILSILINILFSIISIFLFLFS